MIKKSAIFYLVNNNPIHLRRLYSSLEQLKKNFLEKYNYPVVFGHEGLPDDVIASIKAVAPEKHYFHTVNFSMPDYPDEIKNAIPEKFKGHWDENAFFSIGYRHMCRFYAGSMYKDPFFDNVKYLMRLDCDSYFTDEVTEDIFQTMASNKCIYGHIGEEEDMDYVIEGLNDHCTKYFGTSNPTVNPKGMYKTHFEVVDFQWFKDKEYTKYFNSIDETGNIYIKRWGDAPIKYQGVKYLVPSTKIYQFDLPYKHGGDL